MAKADVRRDGFRLTETVNRQPVTESVACDMRFR